MNNKILYSTHSPARRGSCSNCRREKSKEWITLFDGIGVLAVYCHKCTGGSVEKAYEMYRGENE